METRNEIRIEKIKKIISVLNLNQSEFANSKHLAYKRIING